MTGAAMTGRDLARTPRDTPLLYDLFCCEGGAAVGYQRAGFEVVGFDLFEQYSRKRYPFDAHRWDAIEALYTEHIGRQLLDVVRPGWHGDYIEVDVA